jgi:succinoglycan biosynthesis transport protein ExoP
MEEEINLREYIEVLIRHWYWIIGLALAGAIVAFGASSLLAPTYEATAMVIVTQPRYQFQFDPRLQNLPFDPTRLSSGYPSIATSDELLLSVADAMDPPLPPERRSPDALRKMLSAQTAGDPNLIKLVARSRDPQEAARLANGWAQRFVQYLNDVYGTHGDLALFESQAAEAQALLQKADLALAAFRSQYGLGFAGESDAQAVNLSLGMARRLQARTDLLTQYEARQDRITQLLGEARTAAAQVDSQTSPAIVAGLLADMLQLGLLDGGATPIVQIDLGGLDARAGLSALITSLEAKQQSTDETITRLKGEVESLQAELADRQQELDQLLRDRQVAQDTYLTLSNKLQEARIEAQDGSGDVVRLLSRAATPEEPASPRRLLNTAVAGALGLMVGAFGAFFLEYWRQETPAVATAAGLAAEQTSARS